MKPMYFLYR